MDETGIRQVHFVIAIASKHALDSPRITRKLERYLENAPQYVFENRFRRPSQPP